MYLLRTSFVIALSFVLLSGLQAQEKAFTKVSPRTRIVLMQRQHNLKAAARSKAFNPGFDQLKAFVEVNDTTVYQQLRQAGCQIFVNTGTIATMSIPVELIDSIAALPAVEYIDASRPLMHHLDSVRSAINVLPAYAGTGLKQPYTGKGVLVGIVDGGFDYTHPTFYDATGTTYRVKRVVDISGSTEKVFSTQSQILAQKYSSDGLTDQHGTHVAGIAAGGGYTTNYRGVAYGSDIMIACVAEDDASLLKGVKDVMSYADVLKMPAVVNLSSGSTIGAHDGTDLFDKSIMSMTGKGKIIVSSAGNAGDTKAHVDLTVPGDTLRTFLSLLQPASPEMYADIWSGKEYGNFSVSVDLINKRTMKVLGSTGFHSASNSSQDGTSSITVNGNKYSISFYTQLYNGNHKRNVQVSCTYPDEADYNNVFLLRVTSKDSLTRLWTDENAEFTAFHKGNPYTDGDYQMSIASPALDPTIIGVGASCSRTSLLNVDGKSCYSNDGESGQMAGFSSHGPTDDHRTKPDVTAVGANVVSAFNSYYLATEDGSYDLFDVVKKTNFNGRSYAWGRMSGTSMSCPAVTGSIALWLQANPNLTPQDVLGIISRTSTHKAGLTYPNNEWGYGIINVYDGLLDILGIHTAIRDVFRDHPEEAVSVFPGQSAGEIHVRWATEPGAFSIQVIDMEGRLVSTVNEAHSTSVDYRFVASVTPHAVYLVRITTAKGTVSRKLTF